MVSRVIKGHSHGRVCRSYITCLHVAHELSAPIIGAYCKVLPVAFGFCGNGNFCWGLGEFPGSSLTLGIVGH